MDDKNKFENVEKIAHIKAACTKISQNSTDLQNLYKLQELLRDSSPTLIKIVGPNVFSVFYLIFKNISESKTCYSIKEKQLIVDTLCVVLRNIKLDILPLFFNIYGFLLFEVYDFASDSVIDIEEEYKLSIIECMTSLANSLSSSQVDNVYKKENSLKFCQMVNVLLNVAKNDTYKKLRISAITCIMAIARVLDDDDFNDVVVRNQVAEMFLFFLPGLATQLKSIALSDEKVGHKVPTIAVKAWGRIVTLLMQDYNASDQKINLYSLKELNNLNFDSEKSDSTRSWKSENDLKQFINDTKRSPEWYRKTDKRLQILIIEFNKLAHHTHPNVRMELVNMASLLINNCSHTMPSSLSHLLEIILTLSEDSNERVNTSSKAILADVSQKFSTDEFKPVLDNLEEGFYNNIISLPRKFNGIDDDEKVAALNLLIGYINLFGESSLKKVLYSAVHLNRLVLTLIHICDLDKSNITLLEEYRINDFEDPHKTEFSWKQFSHFKDNKVCKKIEILCRLFAKYETAEIIIDFLLDMLTENTNHSEIIFLINEILTGSTPNNLPLVKNVLLTFTTQNLWYLSLEVGVDDFGYEYTLGDIQDNVLQTCLLIEGIGKIAITLQNKFKEFLLKTLYLILERAGSSHGLIRNCGLTSLKNIATACGYSNITQLINSNIDYFAFHVERKLNKPSENVGALNVLTVVMKYSDVNTLEQTCNIIRELLIHSNDSKSEDSLEAYFHVFQIFIQCLYKWLNIRLEEDVFKTKKQKQEEFENFKVSGIDPIDNFTDESVGKSAEEMYREDMEKGKTKIDDELRGENYSEAEYKKPDPPVHVKLVITILTKSLHYLPSKKQSRKLLILEILKTGIEILRCWEDELLPIVHQIWSPLVDRFKEFDNPLIINYSFQLLIVLSRLSKDFIRSRTSKEVLPSILQVLDKYSKESYLKDRGSAYRYSQSYKLQLLLLKNLAKVLMNLDMLESDLDKTMNYVFAYISEKQPQSLQGLALKFFDVIIKYDPKSNVGNLKRLLEKTRTENEYVKNGELVTKLIKI